MLFNKLVILFSLAVVALCESDSLQQVDNDELLGLFRNEKYVVVLFTRDGCPECEKLETALTNIREDLVETCGAWVVKANNSPLVSMYSPGKAPAIVFLRHGVPLFYDGDYNEDAMAHFLIDNKEPIVKELSDETFEHLTQSSSGATTGDWFIMFYSNDCLDCLRLQAKWETVGARLKTRLNVARVNSRTLGQVTSRRFRIEVEPTFLLFRLGKMYHFLDIPRYDVASFVNFATVGYKHARSEKVPVPKSPFDDFTQQIADQLRKSGWLWRLIPIVISMVLTLTLVLHLKAAEIEKAKKAKTEAAEETKSKKPKPEAAKAISLSSSENAKKSK